MRQWRVWLIIEEKSYMATYQIELNNDTENLLQNLVQQTSLSVNELVIQGLLVLKNNVELTVKKSDVRFFDIYSQVDIGKDNNCAYSSDNVKAGVKAILQNKLRQG